MRIGKRKGRQSPVAGLSFDPDNNIELGTAYLNVLTYSQLDDVTDMVSREYCVISAYNTGAGNVFKTFAKDQRTALQQINGLQPSTLYDRLRSGFPTKRPGLSRQSRRVSQSSSW